MQLAIFGATGRTGQHLVQLALAQGHTVRALARTPSKLTIQNPSLTVIQGDAANPDAVAQVIDASDAVLSVMGPTSNAPVLAVSQGMHNVIRAMHAAGVRRIVISAGAGVGAPGDQPKLFNKLMNVVLKATAKNVYADMLATVEAVRASGLDWTVVRVPMLTDGALTGNVRVGMVGRGMGPRISRADLADYMLKQFSTSAQVAKSPAISN